MDQRSNDPGPCAAPDVDRPLTNSSLKDMDKTLHHAQERQKGRMDIMDVGFCRTVSPSEPQAKMREGLSRVPV